EQRDVLFEGLAKFGFKLSYAAKKMPIVIGAAPPETVPIIARLGAHSGTPEETAVYSVDFHKAYVAHNAGYYGDNLPIGIIDTGPCRFRHDHEIFDWNSVSYTDGVQLGQSCTT